MNNQQDSSDEIGTQGTGRRHAAIGVTAGLLGGGAIGLLMAVPSITSAATDDSSTVTSNTPVVQLQDSGDEAPVGDEASDEAGSRLRDLLQDLVDDGTITDAQADAVTDHLVENRPDRPGRGHHRGPARDGDVVAALIGIDVDVLRDELRAGNSIADVAEANGVDPQVVVDALIDELEGHLDLAVEDGRLTTDEAATALERRSERIEANVHREPRVRD